MDDYPETLIRQAKQLLRSTDTMSAAEFLSGQDDAVTVMRVYADLVNQLYWKEKDLPAVMGVALCGIQYGMTYPTGKGGAELRYDLRSRAKSLAYNLASFTWPGWDEPALAIGPAAVALGLDAAKLNLRLAEELNKGDLSMCRGHWMLGAQLLANGQRDGAVPHFRESAEFARRAESVAEVWLANGFAGLARRLEVPDDEGALNEMRQAQIRLSELDNGKEFLNQILTATRVFGAEIPSES